MQVKVAFGVGARDEFDVSRIEQMLARSVKRFERRLRGLNLYIKDVNGPKGGVDKQCRCVLHLRRMPPIVITDQAEDADALIHRVANRAAYSLSQKLDRQNKRRIRQGSQRP